MEVKFTCKSDDVVHSFGILDECQRGNHPKKTKTDFFEERPRWQLNTFFYKSEQSMYWGVLQWKTGNLSHTWSWGGRWGRGIFQHWSCRTSFPCAWVRGEPDACPQFCTWEKISQTTSCKIFFLQNWYLSSTNFKYNVNFSTRVNK